jgi:tRNA dimethylallyltransferase
MVPSPGVTAILTGPTASGKTALALEIARAARRSGAAGIELINADSMVVYRGMDIGTAKPSRAELEEIPHHLVDVRDPDEPFTAADFVRGVKDALEGIHERGNRALIVGGTGFYLKALLYGLWDAPEADPVIRARLEKLSLAELHARLARQDEASALRIGPHDQYRLVRALELIELTGKTPTQLQAEVQPQPDARFELWICDREPAELERRIHQRTRQMLDDGLLDEVARIRARYPAARSLGAVGYKEACAYLDGAPPAGRKIAPGLAGLQDEIELATRQLVKRQRTWFKNLGARLGAQARSFRLPSEDWKKEVERLYPSPGNHRQ